MIDTLSAAHASGYAHGLAIGFLLGCVLGGLGLAFAFALAIAAKEGDRAIAPDVVRPKYIARVNLN